ncbi:MAG: hypothetical protein K2K16_04785 [Ruminococcus sp.]|nr:hypothetical protein [Ruminococcus sp.]
MEKQLSAYTTDTSEETKAKVQQLKVSLQETQYDKYVSDQKKLLNELYNEYETILNQRLDAFIGDMIQDINDNSGMINNTLISKVAIQFLMGMQLLICLTLPKISYLVVVR